MHGTEGFEKAGRVRRVLADEDHRERVATAAERRQARREARRVEARRRAAAAAEAEV